MAANSARVRRRDSRALSAWKRRCHEGVAGLVHIDRQVGVGFADAFHVGRRDQFVGLAQVKDGRDLGRVGQVILIWPP